VVVRARVVLAEVGMHKGVVQRLVVDPQEEELAGLQMGLELEGDDFKGDSFWGEWFRFGCDCSRERVHLALIIVRRVFIDN
jgi:hypothetical protein